MARDDRELRFEEPTPLKRREARERGQGPRSRDLVISASLLAGVLVLRWWGPALAREASAMVRLGLSRPELRGGGLSSEAAAGAIGQCLVFAALGALPVALAVWLSSALAGLVQVGVGLRAAALAPDLSRLSPGKGLARLLEARSAARLVFTAAKLCLAGVLLASVLSAAMSPARLRDLGRAGDLGSLWAAAWGEIVRLGWQAAAACLVLALADYWVQRWLHERELRMTRAEVLEEVVRVEGNPELKRRRLRWGRELIVDGPRQREG